MQWPVISKILRGRSLKRRPYIKQNGLKIGKKKKEEYTAGVLVCREERQRKKAKKELERQASEEVNKLNCIQMLAIEPSATRMDFFLATLEK